MANVGYHNLSVGDVVRLLEPVERISIAPGVNFDGKRTAVAEVEVKAIYTNHDGSFYAFEDTDGTMFGGTTPYDIEVVSYVNGLPNADYIVWQDWDRNRQIAYRDGHPGNNAWVYNGKTYEGRELAEIVSTHPISILELQEA